MQMAEATRFERMEAINLAEVQAQCIKPLCHASKRSRYIWYVVLIHYTTVPIFGGTDGIQTHAYGFECK